MNDQAWNSRIDREAEAALDDLGAIAVIGLSPRPERDSHRVAAYMQQHGFRIIPVNPAQAGNDILGQRTIADLAEAREPVGTVVVFRRSEDTDAPIAATIAAGAKTVWLQLGIENRAGLERARAAGLRAVENRCLMVEHRRRTDT